MYCSWPIEVHLVSRKPDNKNLSWLNSTVNKAKNFLSEKVIPISFDLAGW